MFARVTSGELSPDDVEKFVAMVRDQVIPRAEKLGGFKGGYWLADRESGRVMGITMFESEEALRASQSQADRIREEASRQAGLSVPSFATYEVVASVGDEKALAA
jgi:heme-degrading monooxygenase HmoA